MKISSVILIFGFFLFSKIGLSQDATAFVSVENFNVNLLDSLVFEEVINQRKSNDLARIFWSQAMADSAKLHVAQMQKEDRLFYRELRKGQCVLDMEIIDNAETYSSLSKKIVDRWLLSPGHQALLLGPLFIYGATSSSVFKSEGAIKLKSIFYISYEP